MRGLRTNAALAGMAAIALVMSGCGSKSNNAKSTGAASTVASTPAASSTAGGATSSAPVSGSSSAVAGKAINACMVLDTGGVDDKSFNQSSWAGMQAANKAHPNIKISYVPSNSGNEYTPNLKAEVQKGCDTVIGVGGLMQDNVKAVSAANPKIQFAEVDGPSTGPNVYGLQYNTAQGAFLGGYLAAGMTKTGKVATWGGLNILPITIYMDGFWEGVQYYNQKNKKNVQVLGWTEKNQKGGTFVNEGSTSFNDQNKGKQISQTFIQQGADILFPVAGGSGLGSATAAQASGGRVSVIWVDTDGCVSVPQFCNVFLTSVTKGLSLAVQNYLGKAASGTYPTGSFIGTLANGGTGIAPFHNFDSKVPAALKGQLAQIKAGISGGSIKITSKGQPAP